MYQFYSPYFSHKSSQNELSKIGTSGIYDYHFSGDYFSHTSSDPDRDIHTGIEPEVERPKSSQYITPNCVLLSYFNGDVSSVVDEHFSRALSQPSSYTLDKGSNTDRKPEKPLMCHRKLPPSFWNSNYRKTSSFSSPSGFDSYRDPYFPPSWYSLQNNHWPYRLPSHAHSELGQNFTYPSLESAGKFGSPYQSLVLSSSYDSRQNKYDFAKSMDSLSNPSGYYGLSRLGMDLATKSNIDSTMPGIEYQLQSARREMCW